MRKWVAATALLIAVFFAVQTVMSGETKKISFDTLKDCMMCMKKNRDDAKKALDERDYSELAGKAKMLGDCAVYAKKKFCTSMDFAMGCDMQKKSADDLLKAAKAEDYDDAQKALDMIMKNCMKCHKMCKGD